MKRVVILELKTNPVKTGVYRSCMDLVLNNKEAVGICVGALWNALCKGGGYYENKRCKVYYRNIGEDCKSDAKETKTET